LGALGTLGFEGVMGIEIDRGGGDVKQKVGIIWNNMRLTRFLLDKTREWKLFIKEKHIKFSCCFNNKSIINGWKEDFIRGTRL